MSYSHKDSVQSKTKEILNKKFKYKGKGVWKRIEPEDIGINQRKCTKKSKNDLYRSANKLMFFILTLSIIGFFLTIYN